MNSVSEIADFIAKSGDLKQRHWQIFDLSSADGFIEEMCRQYEGCDIVFDTPPPSQNSVFFCLGSIIFIDTDLNLYNCFSWRDVKLKDLAAVYNLQSKLVVKMFDDLPEIEKQALREHEPSIVLDIEERRLSAKKASDKKIEVGNIGKIAKEPYSILCAIASEFVGYPIANQEKKELPRSTRRRLERQGVTVDVRTVSLSHNPARYQSADNTGIQKVLHYCRGHWRVSTASTARLMPDGRLGVWIKGHWRGNPDLGVVLHNYVATMQDVQKRSALIL